MQKNKIILASLLIILSACYIPRDVIEDYTQCYDLKINNIDKLCKLNGFYDFPINNTLKDSYSFNLMLYYDGTIAFNVRHYLNRNDVFRENELYKTNSVPSWGSYKLYGNDIVAQKINFSFIGLSTVTEYRIKIVNDSTLCLISSKGLTKKYLEINDSTSNHYIPPLKFIPLVNKPDSTCWLKEKRWFWCDKQKYKEYKKSLKQNKR